MRRVLITGGAGFIGSHVVDKLADAGHAPRIYDLRPSPHHAPGTVDTVIGDVFDRDTLLRAMEGCEAVVHLAACADVGVVADQPAEAEEANARGTLAVLEAARATGARIIYGSTIWVYGASGHGLVTEDSPLGLPRHLYTATKLAGEMYCTAYAELYGVTYTILRFGIPYGPRARPAAVLPIFVSKALKGEPLTITGDGLQTRRFVYVEDLAEGVVAAVERGGENRVYNMAGEEAVTIRQLAEIVSELIEDTEVCHTPGRTADFDGAAISNRRAANELGWHASTPLREGVRRYLAWLNPESALAWPGGASPPADASPGLGSRAGSQHGSQSAVPAGSTSGAWVVGLACALGTLIPFLLALRTDEFGTGQAEYVAISCLIAILAAFCFFPLGPSGRSDRGGMIAGWLIAAYACLQALPWTRHRLELGLPHRGTIALCLIGLSIALALASAAVRLRGGQAARDPVG